MNYEPLFSNILVKPIPKDTGTIIVEPEPTEPTRGEIVGTGPGEVDPKGGHFSLEVGWGKMVLFFPRDAEKLTLDGEEFYLLDQHDVLLVENR